MPEGLKPRLSTKDTVDKQVIQSIDLLCTECTCIRVLQTMTMKSVRGPTSAVQASFEDTVDEQTLLTAWHGRSRTTVVCSWLYCCLHAV
jgi:hypothetical protein